MAKYSTMKENVVWALSTLPSPEHVLLEETVSSVVSRENNFRDSHIEGVLRGSGKLYESETQ